MTEPNTTNAERTVVNYHPPRFWRSNVPIWFHRVESGFRIKGITSDQDKYDVVADSLDNSILSRDRPPHQTSSSREICSPERTPDRSFRRFRRETTATPIGRDNSGWQETITSTTRDEGAGRWSKSKWRPVEVPLLSLVVSWCLARNIWDVPLVVYHDFVMLAFVSFSMRENIMIIVKESPWTGVCVAVKRDFRGESSLKC